MFHYLVSYMTSHDLPESQANQARLISMSSPLDGQSRTVAQMIQYCPGSAGVEGILDTFVRTKQKIYFERVGVTLKPSTRKIVRALKKKHSCRVRKCRPDLEAFASPIKSLMNNQSLDMMSKIAKVSASSDVFVNLERATVILCFSFPFACLSFNFL